MLPWKTSACFIQSVRSEILGTDSRVWGLWFVHCASRMSIKCSLVFAELCSNTNTTLDHPLWMDLAVGTSIVDQKEIGLGWIALWSILGYAGYSHVLKHQEIRKYRSQCRGTPLIQKSVNDDKSSASSANRCHRSVHGKKETMSVQNWSNSWIAHATCWSLKSG